MDSLKNKAKIIDIYVKNNFIKLSSSTTKVLKFFSINPKFYYIGFLALDYFYFDSAFLVNIFIMILCDLFIWVLKRIIKRSRPLYENQSIFGLVSGLGTDAYSFPSSHTFTAFQFIPLFISMFGLWGALLVPYSFLVGISRLSLKHHYFTDVLAGAILGLTFAVINITLI